MRLSNYLFRDINEPKAPGVVCTLKLHKHTVTDVCITSSNALKPGVLSKWTTADVSVFKQTLQLVYAWFFNVMTLKARFRTHPGFFCRFSQWVFGIRRENILHVHRSERRKALSHSRFTVYLNLGSNESKGFRHNDLAWTSSLLK